MDYKNFVKDHEGSPSIPRIKNKDFGSMYHADEDWRE